MCTLLNGKNLSNLALYRSLGKKSARKTICYSTNPNPGITGNINPTPPPNNSGNSQEENVTKRKIDPNTIEKGLKSLDNPVLRGSYTLILPNEKMDFLDQIAKKAFTEITSYELYDLSPNSPINKTIHLKTNVCGIQARKPGVYVIQHKETGKCVIGQTNNLKNRFNQYISRANRDNMTTDNINKAYYLDVLEKRKQYLNLNASQIIQRYVVYTWVDENNEALDIGNSLILKNEMNYLEHRLILAFIDLSLLFMNVA